MNVRLRAIVAALLSTLSTGLGYAFASESPPTSAARIVAQATAAYTVELDGLHAYAPRSKASDTISIAYSVALNGKEFPVETVTLHNALAADADVTIPTDGASNGLPKIRFTAGPADTVTVRYAVVNAKGAAGSALAQGMLTRFIGGGGRPAPDYNDSLWPSATTPLTPAMLFNANCDGAVAFDAYTLSGSQIAHSVAEAKGSFLVSKNYQGGDASSGCGTQSNYDVVVRFAAGV